MSMAAGLSLWIRLAAIQAVPGDAVWVWVALAGSLLAGLLAWVQRDAGQSIAYVAIGYAGLLIAAGSGIGVTAINLTLGAAAWLLAINVLVMAPAFNIRNWAGRFWGIPVLIAIATLLGLPVTVGMAYRTALHVSLAGARWLWWGLVVLIEILLAGAAVRCALAPRPTPVLKDRSLLGWIRALSAPIASLVVAILPLIVLGVWPGVLFGSQAELFEMGRVLERVSGARGWIGWFLPLIGVTALFVLSSLPVAFRQWVVDRSPIGSERLRSFLERGSQVTRRILDLGWLYDLAMNNIRRAARLLSNLAALTEGKGALVWMLLLIVLALLYLSEPGG